MATVLLAELIFVAPAAALPSADPGPVATAPAADPKESDEPVVLDPADEVPELRTATSRTFALGDDRYAVEAFADPVFYQPDGAETFEPIDLDFATSGDRAIQAVDASPVEVEVGAQAHGLIRLAFDGHEITLRPLPVEPAPEAATVDVLEGEAPALGGDAAAVLPDGAAPVALDAATLEAALAEPVTADDPTAERQRADIASVLPGVDLRVFAHADGTSNFLVLHSRPSVSAWTFAVTARGLALVPGTDGGLEFVDATGTAVARMPAPYAVDSTPDKHTGSGRTTTAAWYTLSELDGQSLVTVSVDPAWLADAVYPVYVDPSVTVYNEGTSANGDVHVNEGNPSFHYANYQRPDSPYYYEMWLGESPSNSSYFNMAFIQFNLAAYYGNVVDDARLEVRPYHQYYDAPTSTRAYLRRVTESWVEDITWNTRPSATSSGMTYEDCVEGQQCAFDLTAIAANWLDGDYLDAGIRLDEIDTTGARKGPTYWKRLIASEQGTSTRPRLIFTYHNPAVPAYPSGGPTSSRTLSWTTDTWTPTGYQVQVATDAAFTSVVASSGTVTGTAATGWAIPAATTLTPGTTYYWQVKIARAATDVGTRWSPWSAAASFTYNPDANLGSLGHNTYESFDLGSGDSLAVNVSTGNLVVSHPIVTLPIRGGSLPIGLTHNSFDTADVGLGAGWRLTLQRSVSVSGTSATFIDADGARHVFTGASTAGSVTTWTRPATLYANLRRDTADTGQEITLTYRDQTRDTFRASDGRLVKTEDRFGNAVTLGYAGSTLASVTDPAGRQVTFSWSASALAITDWASVAGGIVQASGTPNRTHRVLLASGVVAGWANAMNTASTCPSLATDPVPSHLTCLVTSGAGPGSLTKVRKAQTYTTLSGSTLGTATRTLETIIGYRGTEVASVQDAGQGSSDATTITRPGSAAVTVVRKGTPVSTTTYGLQAATDTHGRVKDVTRKLGTGGITQRTTWDATYPIDPASVVDNYGASPSRTVSYTYVASSMGLVARMVEPLDGTYSRWTDYTYNSNNDVTQTIVSRQGDATLRTTTRSCYTTVAGCSTAGTDLLLRSTIEHYVDGTAGNGTKANEEDVTTSYQYDVFGQRTRETRHNHKADGTLLDQRASGWTYNADGTVATSIANYADGTVSGSGDDVTPSATTGARTDLTTVYGYDSAGNQVTSADPRRAIALAQGTTLHADDYVTRSTYDALGQRVNETTPRTPGITITCAGTSPDCRNSSWEYDELGSERLATDFGNLVTGTEFDAAGRAVATYEDPPDIGGSKPADTTSISVFDAAGRVLTAKDQLQVDDTARGYTAYAYDELGRQLAVADAVGTAVATETDSTYDNLDRKISETAGIGGGLGGVGAGAAQTTVMTYDAGGRVIKVDDEFTCTSTSYDWRDLPTSTSEGQVSGTCTGAGQRTITHSLDALGRTIQSEVTSGTTGVGDKPLIQSFDAAGRVLTSSSYVASTAVTTSVTSTYNPLDQAIEEDRSDGSLATTSYDPAGNATDRCYWAVDPTPDEACRPVGSTFTTPPTRHTTAEFDARNNRVKLRDAYATTVYDPDHNYLTKAIYVPTKKSGDVIEVEHQSSFTYDERHRLKTVTHRNCTLATPGADPNHDACSSTPATGSVTYDYDANDNRTQVNEANGATTADRFYCYDALDRLVFRNTSSACSSSVKDEAYGYDDAGNLTSFDTDVAAAVTFGYSSQGQLCKTGAASATDCASPNVTYDASGRTAAYSGWYLTYDADGRLKTACRSATCASTHDKVEMVYDGEGRRTVVTSDPAGATAATTREFRYQGDAIVEERVDGVLDRSYLVDESGSVLQMDIPSGTGAGRYLVTYNGHGDAMALWKLDATTGGLTLANSFTYGTWGAPSVATHNSAPDLGFRFRYVGEFDVQWDGELGLGLYYMHARHYAPGIGRFLQPDPDRSEANLYAYAANNPGTEIDPDGTCFIVCGIIGAAVSVAIYAATTDSFDWGEAAGEALVGGALSMTGVGLVAKVASGAKLLSKVSKATRVVSKASRITRRVDQLAARRVAQGAMKTALRYPRVLQYVSPKLGRDLARRAGWRVTPLAKKTSSAYGRGVRLMEQRGGGLSGRQLRWHPGGGHHGARPYWTRAMPNAPIRKIYQ